MKRKVKALAPPPKMKSRKRARKVTTMFHKLTRMRDEALDRGDKDEVKRLETDIEQMGGREEYQRASQVSTSFHSTSKWVLGYLARNGWLYGIKCPESSEKTRRKTRILEVGAINTELLDAASAKKRNEATNDEEDKYRITVRAIDLNSMHPSIEEADFLKIPLSARDVSERYDVIVNSMVLNCVTKPEDRGEMIARLFHFLRPDGLCFVTIPKTCLNLSPFIDKSSFERILTCTGFDILETKESPKIAFFICRRPADINPLDRYERDVATQKRIYNGKKYRTDFSVCLTAASASGVNIPKPL